jgi:hypothetical protein
MMNVDKEQLESIIENEIIAIDFFQKDLSLKMRSSLLIFFKKAR